MQVKKHHLQSDLEQMTGFKLGKVYHKVVYGHPAYLTYMQSTSCEMVGWMKHKLSECTYIYKLEVVVTQSCPTLYYPMDCSPPGSSVHRISQARILEWVAISFSLLSAIRVVSSAYQRLLIFLLETLIPACDSSSQAFHMMYSAYKLNKQSDNMQL